MFKYITIFAVLIIVGTTSGCASMMRQEGKATTRMAGLEGALIQNASKGVYSHTRNSQEEQDLYEDLVGNATFVSKTNTTMEGIDKTEDSVFIDGELVARSGTAAPTTTREVVDNVTEIFGEVAATATAGYFKIRVAEETSDSPETVVSLETTNVSDGGNATTSSTALAEGGDGGDSDSSSTSVADGGDAYAEGGDASSAASSSSASSAQQSQAQKQDQSMAQSQSQAQD